MDEFINPYGAATSGQLPTFNATPTGPSSTVAVVTPNLAIQNLNGIKSAATQIDSALSNQAQRVWSTQNMQQQADAEKAALAAQNQSQDKLAGAISGATQALNPPAGWDATTYANFKKANPGLEPDAQDTAMMNGASNPGMTAQGYSDWQRDSRSAYIPYEQAVKQGLTNTQTGAQSVISKEDQAYNDFKKSMDQVLNGTLPLSPAQQAILDSTKALFDATRTRQIQANQAYEGAMSQLQINTGRSQYSPIDALGQFNTAVNDGVRAISELDAKAAQTLGNLRAGFMSDNYKVITDSYAKFQEYSKQKTDQIEKMNKAALDAQKLVFSLTKPISESGEETQKWALQQLQDHPDAVTLFISQGGKVDDLNKLNLSQLGYLISETPSFKAKQAKDAMGSGIVGEYQYYVQQETAAGRKPLSFDAYQTVDANRKAKVAGAGTAALTNAQINATVNQIAGSFDNEQVVKNFNVIAEGYNFAKSLDNSTKNPADDQALIYSLAKALDPNSVVREGEYATAQKYAQSWIKAYGKGVSQALQGTGFLSEDARKNIKDTIEQRYKISEQNYKNVYNEYQRRLQEAKSGSFNSITDYSQAYQTTQMKGPDGKLYNVPNTEIEQFIKDGGQRVSFNEGTTSASDVSPNKVAEAIAGIESGGNYNAVSPVNRNGEKAYGKYQILASNIPKWAKQVLGKTVTVAEFLASPSIQEQIATTKIAQLLQNNSADDVAAIWFSGRPLAGNSSADVIGVSVPDYVKKFRKNLSNLS